MIQLDEKEAFLAMFKYLEEYYRLTKSSEIAILLGSMQLLPDGLPADAAIWKEWTKITTSLTSTKE